MKTIFRALTIAGLLRIHTSWASEVGTNAAPESLMYATNTLFITDRYISNPSFIDQWTEELAPNGARVLYDRFGPPSSFHWIQAYDAYQYGIGDYANKYGQKATLKIMEHAGREASVKTLPLSEYEDAGRRVGEKILGFAWRLYHGSIGNTAEEDSKTVSATTSYSSLRHIVEFEWNEPKDRWNGEYGWRPWRDNPYAYLNNNFGHHAGRQFLRTEVRCYGYLRPRSFGMIKTEARALITLSENSQLVLGGYAYPFETEEKYSSQGSVRFETYWRDSLITVGVASGVVTDPFWSFTWDFWF